MLAAQWATHWGTVSETTTTVKTLTFSSFCATSKDGGVEAQLELAELFEDLLNESPCRGVVKLCFGEEVSLFGAA